MNWLNLNVSTLDSETFLGSEPLDRATWLCLLRYCIGQENGGLISGAESWGDRKWQQLVRVTKREVNRVTDLWSWDNGSLILWGYPADKEAEVKTNRENGSKGGRPKSKPIQNHPVSNPGTDRLEIAETERKGIERNGKEREKKASGSEQVSRKDANSPEMIRVGKILNRRDDTKWTDDEIKAFRAIGFVEDEIRLVEAFYAFTERGNEPLHRRTSLITLLRHWGGEVDKGRLWSRKYGYKPANGHPGPKKATPVIQPLQTISREELSEFFPIRK